MTPPQRILVATPLPPEVTGGIEEYAFSVIDALRSGGNDVRVVTSRYGATAGRSEVAYGVTSLRAKEMLGRPVCFDPRSYRKLFTLVRRADVVHVHMPFPFVEAVVAVFAKVLGKPVVVTYHMDAVVDRAARRPVQWMHRAAERLYRLLSAIPAVDLADRVCTNTRAYARGSPVLRTRMDRITVIHQGIDARKYGEFSPAKAAAVRRKLLGDRYSKLVCFVGRLVPYKGLHVLLDAIRARNPRDTLFVIGGRGPEESRLRRAIADEGLANVRLLGYVPDGELMNLFGAADLVVAPSISSLESTPITLLYASAAGTRVLGTDVGGTEESIPNDGVAGLVVPAENPVALGDAMGRLLGSTVPRSAPPPPRYWSDVAADYGNVMRELRSAGAVAPMPEAASRSASYLGPAESFGGK
jgi:glycosyltransferase involved in cell wall biosynthesis